LRLLLLSLALLSRRGRMVQQINREHVHCALFRGARQPLANSVKVNALNRAMVVPTSEFVYHFLAIIDSVNSYNLPIH
jgi:hypothetical protein